MDSPGEQPAFKQQLDAILFHTQVGATAAAAAAAAAAQSSSDFNASELTHPPPKRVRLAIESQKDLQLLQKTLLSVIDGEMAAKFDEVRPTSAVN